MNDKASQEPIDPTADWRDGVTWYTHETTFAHWLKRAAAPLFRTQANVQLSGLENIPLEGRLIMAFNHISNFDVPFIVTNLPRHPFFMAKKELFKNAAFGWVIRQFGGFPINRGERDPWSLEQAGRILEAEQMLFMFPEGTRSGPLAQLQRGKVGAVRLALAYNAPVLPAAIFGTQNVRLGFRRNDLSIQFGLPLEVTPIAGSPPYEYETIQEVTDVVMRHIAAMLPPAHRGVYAEVES